MRVERNEIEETGEYDLEGLFVRLNFAIDSIGAKRVVLDTIETLFGGLSNVSILRGELRRLFRWLKDKGVTAVITGESGEGYFRSSTVLMSGPAGSGKTSIAAHFAAAACARGTQPVLRVRGVAGPNSA